ncbi:putative mitochondrial glycoprotein [Helianthus annuus]|nr:putative mitochondrial glycoprotein [Helianthus annuus]KAJ0541927.1 putative mitochondrial glycoprotein [Helianthus annuus]KAJ0887640.1 putative mitochondrial glycoprotein [Helianthus annuus]KAJ0892598.1 putative mitochondrial glycoprotein [Helianthus annuus]
MAINTILRRSASALTPVAARLLGGQRNLSHHCGGALFSAVNHSQKSISNNSFLVPALSRYSFSASSALKRPTSDESLLRVIESEIQCSEESFEEGDDIPEGFPFKLEDNLGQQTVSLTREYQGETIHVEVEPSSLVTGEEDDDDDDDANDDSEQDNQTSLPMVVRVSKTGGPCLEFGVTAYADEIVIDSLSVKDPEMTEDQLPYEGPRFDELDENLQKAFHKYLEIRGIKPSVTNFLHEYMVNKDHREYTNWLKNLKKFVEA